MEKESPLHFTLQLEYIGEEPSVTIWRNEAIGGIEMMHANGESVLPLVIGDTLGRTELTSTAASGPETAALTEAVDLLQSAV